MEKEKFNYEKYLNFEETPYTAEQFENGTYTIKVGCLTTNFDSSKFDKAGAQILANLTFRICPKAKIKWEIVNYGRLKELSNLTECQRTKLEIMKRQMPYFFKKYKEATPQQFATWARNLLRPMRDCHCKNKLKSLEAKLFEIV